MAHFKFKLNQIINVYDNQGKELTLIVVPNGHRTDACTLCALNHIDSLCRTVACNSIKDGYHFININTEKK